MSIESLAICLNHSKATGTDKVVLLGIANHDGDGGAYPSVATLARYANVSERTVQRSIQTLIELGEVRVEINAGGSAKQRHDRRPNRYYVLVACPATCDKTSQHRVGNGVTTTTLRGDNPDVYGVTHMSPEPSLEPSSELEIINLTNLAEIKPNAGDVTGFYVDCFREIYSLEPPRAHIGRIAKSAKEMINTYPTELLMQAAKACAADGHANLASAITWIAAERTREESKTNKGASAFLRLAQDSLIDY
jgi:hypothetical protein